MSLARLSSPLVKNSTWCPRQETVDGILELLHSYHLVQVRGTPASGKTTLMYLLHAHILKERPDARVFIQTAWPISSMKEKTERIAENLPGYPSFENGETYFLFDEGQTSYWDEILWVAFKNTIQSSDRPVYAILFCSYGNEDVSNLSSPTPLDFGQARVTLDRTDRGLSKPCGLLLNKGEFDDVIRLRPKLLLADDLRNFVYNFTKGHAGAIVAVTEFLLKKREASVLNGQPYRLDDFHQDTLNYDDFCKHLSMDRGIGRGTPKHPAQYAQAMRALLFRGSIPSDPDYHDLNSDVRLKLQEAYQFGFVNKDYGLYTFASPLHAQLWSWRLLPQTNYQLPFINLYSFVKETISHFRPSQLTESDRRVGSASHRPPEAQYQEEYYRCVHNSTRGNVRISPEYAAAAGSRPGRIDFFIPSTKWGIELIRDGKKLKENGDRFASTGAYGQWLPTADMFDYVLLDFRGTMPVQAQPDIEKLYFVVFSDDKTRLDVYNNNLQFEYGHHLMQQG